MNRKIIAGALLLALTLLWSHAANAQESNRPAICFYRDSQATPATRTVVLSGVPQSDAEVLLAELLAGPTRDEQEEGLTSALPPGTELLAVTVSGQEVVVDLRIPLDFLHTELDPYLSDAIVKQIVRTLEPLGLLHFQVRAMDKEGNLAPVSDFLRIPPLPVPAIPDNDEPLPDSPGLEPRYSGQPPAFGQGQPQGALTGTAAWLSAGHGWYWNGTKWTTQRFNYNDTGIVEDLSNAEAVNYYLARYLWNAGADMWLVRDWGMNEHEIIVDNDGGAPGYTTTGTWATSTTPGYAGGTYQWTSTYSTRTATATWTPDLPEAGWYPVWVWYRHAINRPSDSRYEIHHAGGVTPISISQEIHGMTWRYLGEYYFEAGTAGHVTLINQSDDYDPSQAVIADAIRFGGGLGSIEESGVSSNRPRWEEAAKYWVMYQGAPEEVYVDDDGDTNDVIARPRYAEWEAAKGEPGEGENAVFISWHTNGYNGTLTGTESYIHSTEPTPGSVELQDWVHAELISDLRAAWDPGWVNRGQKSANFGELRELSTMPGVLLEVAFHDSASDADALREPVFRQIAARAVYQGIVKYQAQRLGVPVHLLPEPPERLAARNSAPGEVTLTWAPPPCCDGVVGDAATAYKVYHSTNGRGFDNGVVTSSTSLTLERSAGGSLHFFRVTALNDGGESFPTPVVAVRTPASGQLVEFLIVDGFDRLDQTAMISQWENSTLGTVQRMFLERMHSYDYAVEHGQALSACNRAFDGAVNEAVEAGDVALAGYRAVDWFTGEDSVADASLSDVERALLADYLDSGGRLLISGAEIGYDLVEYSRDPAFFRDYLRADYRGDDAGTYQFSGVPGASLMVCQAALTIAPRHLRRGLSRPRGSSLRFHLPSTTHVRRYTTTGTWATSTTPGYAGGTYQWASTYSTRTATATWTPDLPEAGWYPVWVWYRHAINRPSDSRYEIHHAGGVTPISISQEIHGMTWRYLGEYYFEAGTAGHVTLINQSDDYDPSQAIVADAIRFGGGLGSIEESGVSSNRPRWEEAAKYWVMYQGAPEEVYIDDDGDTNDVIARPRYAEWEAAKGEPGEGENAVFISWHTNGYNGTLTGTESYIHSTEPTTGSVELQDWVHAELISDLRAAWDPGWVNRGQKSANFGELRELSTMPGVLLEVAFHDSASDADALREPVFRQIAARAVYQGIVKYQAQRLGVPVHLLPEPPERLAARNSAPGEVTLTWAPPPCCDGVVGDAATAYKVYHSTNGRGFDNGVVTSSTSLTLNGLLAGSLHFFRVTALNDGGESFPTPVVAVRTPASGQLVEFLIVDGFDRLDQTAMISQWENSTLGTVQRMFLERMHSYDYAVEHGQALSACNRAFDGAVNEAVEAGDVALAGYRAVDWFTGEDSVADASLSDVERALLAAYLDSGGRLLISGAEIGYDLVEYSRDPAFFRDYLRADYRGDDAGTYQFSGVPGGIFDGLAGRFDDSTYGTYDVGYPDRVAPLAGSTLALSYTGGTADGAAVSYDGDFGVVYMGFPLETVTDPAVRAGLVCAAADYLVPAPQPLEGTPRIINPGFEQGLGQSAWQASASDGNQIFYRCRQPARVRAAIQR